MTETPQTSPSIKGYARTPGLMRRRWRWGTFFALWAICSIAGVALGYGVIRLMRMELGLLELWAWYSFFFGAIIAALLSPGHNCSKCKAPIERRETGIPDEILFVCHACKRYEPVTIDTTGGA